MEIGASVRFAAIRYRGAYLENMNNPYGDAIDVLSFLALGLRKRSRYKRYSEGLRRAYGNRAVGIEKAIVVLRGLAADTRIEGLIENDAGQPAPLSEVVGQL